MNIDEQLARELREALPELHAAVEAQMATDSVDRVHLVKLARQLSRTSLIVDRMWRTSLAPAMVTANVTPADEETDLRHQLKLALIDLELARDECRNATSSGYNLNMQLLETCLGNASREVERLMQRLIAQQLHGQDA